MTWFKMDDGFWSHPKTSTLSDAAVALWARAGAYCCQHLTDGFVPAGSLKLLGKPSAARELVTANLWHAVAGGWVFHDWHEYQETSETVKTRRAQARDRQRRHRESREQSRNESRVTDTVTDGVSSQPPTRPDPTTVTDVTVEAPQAAPKRPRATRLPDDWMPPPDVIESMKAEHPAVDFRAEHAKFVDYWKAKSGKDATKVDWAATWRNWIRRAAENNTRHDTRNVHKLRGYAELAHELRAQDNNPSMKELA
jgi:hypothetical protein